MRYLKTLSTIYVTGSTISKAGRGVFAASDIAKGEEITTNYNFGNPDGKSKPKIKGVPALETEKNE